MRKRSDKHWEGKLVDEKTDCFRLKIPKGHKTIKNAWPKKKNAWPRPKSWFGQTSFGGIAGEQLG